MALFTGYFDESETPRASVIAGVNISVGQVGHFDDEWKSLLAKESVRSLHMKEFNHFKGDFAVGWREKPSRRAEFIRHAVSIIARRCNLGVSITIDRAAFRTVTQSHRAIEDLYGNEYTAASIFAIMRTGV